MPHCSENHTTDSNSASPSSGVKLDVNFTRHHLNTPKRQITRVNSNTDNRSSLKRDNKRKRKERTSDRYIPSRSNTNIDLIHHLMTTKGTPTPTEPVTQNSETPVKSCIARAKCLFSSPARTCTRLLSYSVKRRLEFDAPCTVTKKTAVLPKVQEDSALRIMEAPGVSKNFYYNLLDWGINNIVVVGLKERVYYWDSVKSQAYVLPHESRQGDLITCLRWKPDATKHIVSHRSGTTKLWDSTVCKLVTTHDSSTVYTSCWRNNNVVSLGCGDGTVSHWDIRTSAPATRYNVTSGIICGLEWDKSGESMAVGCNDNKVQIFNYSHLTEPTETMLYQSAVKALAWCPYQRGLLATGSGQNDQRVVVWDLINGVYKNCIDTKSQVTGVIWSPVHNELLTSHGHFDPNLRLWDTKSNCNTTKLTGHTNMIVSISKCPINNQVISLSADDSLRVWNIFNKTNSAAKARRSSSLLSLDKIR